MSRSVQVCILYLLSHFLQLACLGQYRYPVEFLKVGVKHWHMPYWAFDSTFHFLWSDCQPLRQSSTQHVIVLVIFLCACFYPVVCGGLRRRRGRGGGREVRRRRKGVKLFWFLLQVWKSKVVWEKGSWGVWRKVNKKQEREDEEGKKHKRRKKGTDRFLPCREWSCLSRAICAGLVYKSPALGSAPASSSSFTTLRYNNNNDNNHRELIGQFRQGC